MAYYNGLIFKPHRQFTQEEKNMTLAEMDKHFMFTWDFALGMFDSANVHGNKQKFPYNHKSFYESMGEDAWADIFICELNGKYYVPCSRTVMEIKRNI